MGECRNYKRWGGWGSAGANRGGCGWGSAGTIRGGCGWGSAGANRGGGGWGRAELIGVGWVRECRN